MPPLSVETRRRIDLLFVPDDRVAAAELLCKGVGDTLPFLEQLGTQQFERFRFAALKVSGGDLDALQKAISMAQDDWRDLLCAAGFAEDVTAHLLWLPQRMM